MASAKNPSVNSREWLVTDPKGFFAMGSPTGFRQRKYHGFFMGIPGRTETAFLADLDIQLNGRPLWPHHYTSPRGVVIHPDPAQDPAIKEFRYEAGKWGPKWTWELGDGKLTFQVQSSQPAGIALRWNWHSRPGRQSERIEITVRPFWAMRPLHEIGGRTWRWEVLDSHRAQVVGEDGGRGNVPPIHVALQGSFEWENDPLWYERFYYALEQERGYDAIENIYSAGRLQVQLKSRETASLILAEDPKDLPTEAPANLKTAQRPRPPGADFVLTHPAGIVAGYPWFGEWGRDSFISLPGIVALQLASEASQKEVADWASEVLLSWGQWIEREGMLPNLLGTHGTPQWESADATLWWCHSLAALWAFSLSPGFAFQNLKVDFHSLLRKAIQSIEQGRHRFLRLEENGLLTVTAPHATWMDAKVAGQAVTSRMGALPEINALWFQARALHWLWSKSGDSGEVENVKKLEALGETVLQCDEPERPNSLFLHSIPLAPSFVLQRWDEMAAEYGRLAEKFWTPVGLRTLSPAHPSYKPRCVGTQEQRDLAYHQGAAWGWLGGHFEMVRRRLEEARVITNSGNPMFTEEILGEMPILGHIAEIFDGEAPFSARGAPAQAWSLACLEEANARRKTKTNLRISQILAQRWLDRRERKPRRQKESLGLE